MSLAVHLLGRPHVSRSGADGYQVRSRKSWAVLAYLVLGERPPARSRLASLLFAEADDPLRALRWSLAELRRCLGPEVSLDGDPVVLRLPGDALVDVTAVLHGSWPAAVDLPGLGAELLDGAVVRAAPAFEAWLLSERRRLSAASEAVLHEAALGSMARGSFAAARGYAVRAVAMSPLDENHQALLIRLYRLAGEDDAAEQQFAACVRIFADELGVRPGEVVQRALRERRAGPAPALDDASIEAVVEAGAAAVAAGAAEAGIGSLRTAVRLADGAGTDPLRITARLRLAEALIHSLRGLDEEGLSALHEADRIAAARDDRQATAQARAELGYVDFLRGRYDRAERWLTDAMGAAAGAPATQAKVVTYLGSVESDRGNYAAAVALLERACELSQAAGEPRQQAYARSMLGRVSLLLGDPDAAADHLDASIDLVRREHWLAFLPWPQALRGEVDLARADPGAAARTLTQAFARACQLGDPCWEGMSARGLALAAEAMGETDRAFAVLADARLRCNRLADPYVWLDVHILDAQCELGRRHGHPDTAAWVAAMRDIACRTGMREMTVRSMLHGAALGNDRDAAAAALLAADIDNPSLRALVSPAPR